jgi:hypothetical protein
VNSSSDELPRRLCRQIVFKPLVVCSIVRSASFPPQRKTKPPQPVRLFGDEQQYRLPTDHVPQQSLPASSLEVSRSDLRLGQEEGVLDAPSPPLPPTALHVARNEGGGGGNNGRYDLVHLFLAVRHLMPSAQSLGRTNPYAYFVIDCALATPRISKTELRPPLRKQRARLEIRRIASRKFPRPSATQRVSAVGSRSRHADGLWLYIGIPPKTGHFDDGSRSGFCMQKPERGPALRWN